MTSVLIESRGQLTNARVRRAISLNPASSSRSAAVPSADFDAAPGLSEARAALLAARALLRLAARPLLPFALARFGWCRG